MYTNRILYIIVFICIDILVNNLFSIIAQDKENTLKAEINTEKSHDETSFKSERTSRNQEDSNEDSAVLHNDDFHQENKEFELIDIVDEMDQSQNWDYQTKNNNNNGLNPNEIQINYRIWIISHYIELISNDIFHYSSIFNNGKYDNETIFVSFYSDA
ncbi:uncharacterized protein LOC111632340 [Centruroides sculpturatus]|uniref:uncharacterized protein LOC111628421 n=1 Tax=Centruroides sculpturatus TaxID=218467 RepID=UPI000C6ED9DA|nr:uncharacterized protein LOC111628421 [Centruroides sculpturatus]XP_023232519.1 uncharacterized protein LOC111632340 [Centruroides sculpturatus]